MSPRVKPRVSRTTSTRSSLAEYRNERGQRLDKLSVDDALAQVYAGTLDPEARSFWRYMTSPATVTGDPMDALDRIEKRVLSKASSAAGGYAVPTDFADQIVSVRRTGSIIGQLARTIETPAGTALQVPSATTHGVSAWTAENASFTASDEVFSQVTLSAFKASSSVIVSEELLGDALPDFDGFLAAELGGRQVTLEETAFAVGDGTGKPLGMAAASSGYTVATAATGSTLSFTKADVATAYATLPVAYLPTASWVMAPTAFRSLAGLVDTAGGLVFPTLHAAQPTLYARPVYVSPDLPTSAASARSVVFGDISQAYTVRRVSGLGLHRQDEIFSNNGQVGYRIFWRLDGRPVDLAAGIILRHSAT